jgi:hypothetical protein
MDTVLLAVKKTAETIQEADGGVEYLTKADLGGSGVGTGDASNLATKTNQYISEVVCQTVDFTAGSSTTSATFNASTKRILITPTEDCWVKLGGTATAGGTSFFISAGIPFPPILLNGKTSLSVIGKAGAGQLSIFESH